MKVYFIQAGYDGCYYVRCLLPLVAGGWDGNKTSLLSPVASPDVAFQGAMNADVVVFQRPMHQDKLEAIKLLKQAGKKVVIDNDDTYVKDSGVLKQPFGGDLNARIDQRIEQIDQILKACAAESNLVTVTTEFLQKEYQAFNPNVAVLPNCIDPSDWDEPLRNESDKVRIGLVGSVIGSQDYEAILPIIEELGRRKEVQLVVYAFPPDKEPGFDLTKEIYRRQIEFWSSLPVERQPWTNVDVYPATLNNLRLDLMLIPRLDSYFNRCKSNLKFLEASMCEIPVIAQGFADGNSPYQGTDAQFMKVCQTVDEWQNAIDELIAKKELRREMGRNAKQYVLENYNIYEKIYLWEEAYRGLL